MLLYHIKSYLIYVSIAFMRTTSLDVMVTSQVLAFVGGEGPTGQGWNSNFQGGVSHTYTLKAFIFYLLKKKKKNHILTHQRKKKPKYHPKIHHHHTKVKLEDLLEFQLNLKRYNLHFSLSFLDFFFFFLNFTWQYMCHLM